MAKAKTARQVAASRANIKKAQIASARKRKGKGKGKLAAANRAGAKFKRRQRIVNGVAYAAIGATVGAVAYQHYKRHQHNKRIVAQSRDHARTTAGKMIHPRIGQARHGVNVGHNPSVNHIRSGAAQVGAKLSRQQAAHAKIANAAKGTSGSAGVTHGGRTFIARSRQAQPGGAVSSGIHSAVGAAKARQAARDPNKRRIRIHNKVGKIGGYHAGLSDSVGRKAFVATRHGVSHRR